MSRKKSKIRHNYNPDFDKLLRDAEHNRIKPKVSESSLNPAYHGTRLEKEVKDAKDKARLRSLRDSGSF